MVLDGRSVIDKNMVMFPDDLYETEEQVQPNGVDLRLHAVRHIIGRPQLPAYGRIIADDVQVSEIPAKDGWFDLSQLVGNYLVDFRESIAVQDGWCATIITRSSLLRCGVILQTGLWDTGYNGRIGGELTIQNPVRLQYGARLGQIVFSKAAFSGHRYASSYQGLQQSEIR